MKRSFIIIVVAAALVLALSGIAWAAGATTATTGQASAAAVDQSVYSVSSQVYFVIGQSSYSVNGVVYKTDAAPFIDNGRTFVPVRYLGDSIGAKTDWDGATDTATLTKGDVVVKLTIDSKSILVNDKASTIDVAPVIKDGRTYIPARYVAEAFSYTVGWDPASQTVSIK